MYQALYRKYRPTTFDEVVGQEAVTTVLKNQVRTGRVAHAYLFTGTRGTGKTTCAKILARAVNCLQPREGNPCGECPVCAASLQGQLMDVEEIDAASNNGVDSVRALREEAAFTPAVGRYRVYIIDEVHMLSTSAFNALLKIMEEPPPHVLFILATTELHKVLPTIVSRCQRFDFKKIPAEQMVGRMQQIAREEGFTLEPEAALLIARLADGGLRDALSLLEVCLAGGSQVTAEQVARAAGLAGDGPIFDLADCLCRQDASGALALADGLLADALDPARLCSQLAGHLRNLMLAQATSQPAPFVDCLPSSLPRLQEQAGRWAPGAVLYGLTVLQEAVARMGRTPLRRTELEMALVRLCNPALSTLPEGLLARLEKLEGALRAGYVPAAAGGEGAPAPEGEDAFAPQGAAPPQEERAAAGGGGPSAPAPPALVQAAAPFAPWPQALERMAKINPTLFGALHGSQAYLQGDRLLIDCRDPMFLKMIRENDYTRETIKRAVAETVGRRYSIGPYRPGQAPAPMREDPLERLVQEVSGLPGVTVEPGC